jgi:hypothetical protein
MKVRRSNRDNPTTLALGNLREEDLKFKTSFDYIARTSQKTPEIKQNKNPRVINVTKWYSTYLA